MTDLAADTIGVVVGEWGGLPPTGNKSGGEGQHTLPYQKYSHTQKYIIFVFCNFLRNYIWETEL